MQKLKTMFQDSAREIRRLPALVATSMLIALGIVLSEFRIEVTPQLHISFVFLASAMIGMLFGPVTAMGAGIIENTISYFLRPSGGFFPGFMITAMLCGLIYGLFLYKKSVTWWRVIGAKTFVNLFLNVGLNTCWLAMMYGKSFMVMLPVRFIKNMILLPIEIILLYLVSRAVQKVYSHSKIGTHAQP